jgi:hypothetical protein
MPPPGQTRLSADPIEAQPGISENLAAVFGFKLQRLQASPEAAPHAAAVMRPRTQPSWQPNQRAAG